MPLYHDVLVAKAESTAGTAETLADADFDVRVYSLEMSLDVPMDDEARKYATGDHGASESFSGTRSGSITFEVPLVYSGTANTAPNMFKFFTACGLKQVAYTTVGIGLQDRREQDESTLTIAIYRRASGASPSAKRYLFAGCAGNCVLTASGVGAPIVAQFTFTGKFEGNADITNGNIPVITSPDTTIAEKLINAPLTFGGVSHAVSSWSLDFGCDVQPYYDQADDTGFKHFAIRSKNPTISWNPLDELVATEDIYADVIADAVQSMSLATAAASPNYTIDIPRVQIITPGQSAREGVSAWDLTGKALRNNGSDSNLDDESSFEILHGARS